MPSAKSGTFASGGGILRDKDGVLADLSFVEKKSLKNELGVYAELVILQDGREDPIERTLFVGGSSDFGITEDGKGVTGDKAIPGKLPWGIFAASAGAAGFDEDSYDDSDPNVADYSPLIGGRFRFNWVDDPDGTKRMGQRKAMKDGKPVKGKDGKQLMYNRENLIVTNYYGQVEVDAPKSKSAGKPAVKVAAKGGKKATAPAVDAGEVATEHILAILQEAKGNTIIKVRLGAKLLTALQDVDADVRDAARTWAHEDDNLASIAGVYYDVAKKTLTLSE